jgi:hypothetical protein
MNIYEILRSASERNQKEPWMKKRTCLEKLAKIVTPVKGSDEGFKEWSEQSMFFAFLAEQQEEPSIVL